MTGFDTNFLDGFAQLLATAGVGVFDPLGGAYAATDVAIVMQKPPTTPDNTITLSSYPISDDPALSDDVVGLQVFTRCPGPDPRPTNDLASAVFDQLHGLTATTLATGVRVVQCLRRSGSLLGEDDLNRWERVDNYYVTVHRPSPNRT